ncbi:MAG: EAL domain-containing protein [Pseudomonadota bacterium]
MRFRSFESRIVGLFLFMMLLVQLAGFVAIRSGIDHNARASIRSELEISERVFKRLLQQNAQRLTEGAQLLAADFGFREAVTSNDRETIASALANHGARIGAATAVLIGQDRMIKASSIDKTPPDLLQSILRLVDQTAATGSASGNTLIDRHPYQVVVVPVKAPLTVGWVAMTFPIDTQLVTDMRALSGLQVSILTAGRDGKWVNDVSTLPKEEAVVVAQQIQSVATSLNIFVTDLETTSGQYTVRALPIAREGDHIALALLQRSVSEAIAPYRKLQTSLLLLTALGILIAVAGSFLTARRITTPLKDLARIAERFGRGDYSAGVAARGDDEIGALSRAFETMRVGILRREQEIGRLAYWDTLTNLPNRARFSMQLSEAIRKAAKSGRPLYIIMMDLDRFKNVNDVLGHTFGDALLRQVGERLKLQIRCENDQVARLGGDEFAILLEMPLPEAQAVAARILQSLEEPISLEDQTVDLGAGIGIAGYPEHGNDAESLLSRAEIAMYAAKKTGNEAVVYDPALDKGSQQSLSMLSELRRALERNEFRLYVQPKLSLSSGKLIGLEALIRWVHPEKGMIFPDNFIPFAEKTGFIRMLTRWVLEESAALCRALALQGIHVKISANLSTRDLLDQELPAKFAEVLARHQVQPSSFCLEITESAIMDDPVRAQLTLERFNAMGVQLSIDDFGTGYSSLAYLKRLPVDELKIDKSFVMNMESGADDAKIVRSTIDLGHNMGLRVVAEGIESEAVWKQLAAMGCDQGQGYFMSRPIPSDQLPQWISNWIAPLASTETPKITRIA